MAAETLPQKINDYLLKVEVFDTYATAAAIRKQIQKKVAQGLGSVKLDPSKAGAAKMDDTLPGLVRIGKNPKSSFAFFSFATEADKAAAAEFFPLMKGKRGAAWAPSEPEEHDLNQNGKRQAGAADQRSAKRFKGDPKDLTIHDFTEPLWNMPYDEQLKKKTANLKGTAARMKKGIVASYAYVAKQAVPSWAQATPIVELDEMVASPVISGYRNKVEFSAGYDKDGNPDLGFLFGRTSDGAGHVARGDDLLIVPKPALAIARRMGEIMKASGLPPWEKMSHKGVFRTLLVRTGVAVSDRTTQVHLVELQIQAENGLEDELFGKVEALLLHETDGFGPFLYRGAATAPAEGTAQPLPLIASLYLTVNNSLNNACAEDVPTRVLFGEPYIAAVAQGMAFKVSPRSFFQVNYHVNDLLLQKIAEYAVLNKETILLDLCCGTGTIGLSLASKVKKVIGVDCVASAIEDARHNAEVNGVTNAEYHVGKCEDVVHKLLPAGCTDPVVAVVDPPRSGLHATVLLFLRNCRSISKLVYVSCNQTSLEGNCVALCKPQSNTAILPAFRPIRSCGLDLFPHCDQQEMMVLFERTTPPPPAAAAAPTTPAETAEPAEPAEQPKQADAEVAQDAAAGNDGGDKATAEGTAASAEALPREGT
ncbi:Zinc finger CCCH domain-containing protein 24 [Diplonema papillatum]|nr:Zinc finger CCCH domain-containing protein 24 [Diplonema papillatum]|eukprot:gene4767-7335_t